MVVLTSADAFSNPGHKSNSSHKEVAAHRHTKGENHKYRRATEEKRSERTPGPRIIVPSGSTSTANLPPALAPDLATVRRAIESVRQHKYGDATTLAASINDPAARKLVEWVFLRDSDSPADFDRYDSFIRANPDWPSIPLLRQHAEARLWHERPTAVTVRRFVGERPASAFGRLALVRMLLGEGDRAGASREVRWVWQSSELSAELEAAVADMFHNELTAEDDLVRMDRRIGAKDFDAAVRAAKRLGSAQVAIVKACKAAEANSPKSAALLEAVPKEAQADLGYALCRLHWLLAHDDVGGQAPS